MGNSSSAGDHLAGDKCLPAGCRIVPLMQLVGKAPYVSFFSAAGLEAEMAGGGFAVIERGRHGSGRKDPRFFIVARKVEVA